VKKRLKVTIISAVVLCFIFFIYTVGSIINMGLNAKPQKSDVIIVLGCRVYGTEPSPMLKERLNEGIKLFNQGYGNYIIVSGGKGPGEDITEAEAMQTYIISKGVDKSKIIIEDRSTSTFENISYSSEIMHKHGLYTSIIVSNKYHLKRTSLMAKKNNINASYSGVFAKRYVSYEISGFLREILALWKFYVLGY
jgi:uncharacterized SAM-binding protein YcdF (DUF218 family)